VLSGGFAFLLSVATASKKDYHLIERLLLLKASPRPGQRRDRRLHLLLELSQFSKKTL